MEKIVVNGGKKLKGTVFVSGAKNVALKALVAACLTEEAVVIENVPLISDFFVMRDIIKALGGEVTIVDHTASVSVSNVATTMISLDKAAEIRTSSMFLAPLLARKGEAVIPNPGGCRIGARPIDRLVEGLREMGVHIRYNSSDGYFYAKTEKLHGASYKFSKNTHTGTETLVLAAVLAQGETILENAAQEPEIDELIDLLNSMGGDINRIKPRRIVIKGVEKLHGTRFSIGPDRNEIVTLAIAAIITGGDIFVEGAKREGLSAFLDMVLAAGGGVEGKKEGIRFYAKGKLVATDVATAPYPGFMTDWQGPWSVLMTKADGVSTIHETVYESRFGYVKELRKMGARIDFFNPEVKNPHAYYNFNLEDDKKEYFRAIKIHGLRKLHNAVVEISDLRAGATLVLAALAALGQTTIFGVKHIDRGYEHLDKRLKSIGADIKKVAEA